MLQQEQPTVHLGRVSGEDELNRLSDQLVENFLLLRVRGGLKNRLNCAGNTVLPVIHFHVFLIEENRVDQVVVDALSLDHSEPVVRLSNVHEIERVGHQPGNEKKLGFSDEGLGEEKHRAKKVRSELVDVDVDVLCGNCSLTSELLRPLTI